MVFDPRAEPCSVCGREPDECICGFAPDFLDDQPIPELDDPEDLNWGWHEEYNNRIVNRGKKNGKIDS